MQDDKNTLYIISSVSIRQIFSRRPVCHKTEIISNVFEPASFAVNSLTISFIIEEDEQEFMMYYKLVKRKASIFYVRRIRYNLVTSPLI